MILVANPPVGESWQAVVISLIVTVGGLAGVVVKQFFDSKKLSDVKEQVTNGGSNLAATVGDVKKMLTEQRKDVHGIRQDIGDLRGEVRDERQARLELARAIEDRLKHLERRET
mgnify:CR=1 FL=1